MPTRSEEDYLKYIYRLQAEGSKVSTSSLAGLLNISSASVSEMVVKLSDRGLLRNIPYHGFKLTSKGEKISVNLVRKHRLLEVFLQQHLHYDWEDVHNEAEVLEHVCSDTFIDKLEAYLGFPKFDPHGDPIPDKSGIFPKVIHVPLHEAITGKMYVISQVNDTLKDVLKYLTRIGLRLNSKIFLKERLEYDRSILISVNDVEYLLSGKISENIFVSEQHGEFAC